MPLNAVMMRYYFFCLCCCFYFPAPILGSIQSKNGFLIHGKIDGLKDGALIYLVKYSSKDTVAQAKVLDGKFQLSGMVPNGTEYFYIYLEKTQSDSRSTDFLLENKTLQLEGNISQWPYVRLSGSVSNCELEEVMDIWNSTKEKKARTDKIKKFINSHVSSIYVPDLIRRMDRSFDISERQTMYNNLSESSKNCFFGKQLLQSLDESKQRGRIAPNMIIPSFSVTDVNGESVSIYELASKGKLTLIDFWASWCKPCKEAIPNLKEVYNSFNAEGFNIVSIAVGEKDASWKKALAQDKTDWIHVRDAIDTTIKIFDIPGIPGFILIDSIGKLIAFDCPGSEVKPFGPKVTGVELYSTIDALTKVVRKYNSSLIKNSSRDITNNSDKKITAVKVGAIVPDVELGKIALSASKKTLRVSDFRGKLLILDFWSTKCAVCISQFDHLNQLQQKFKSDLVILPVGFDGRVEGKINQFLGKAKGKYNELKLPSVIQGPQDTTLMKLFPFGSLPHIVWISPSGELLGVTENYALTEANISAIISGKKLKFSEKIITRLLDPQEKLFLNSSFGSKLEFGSVFSGFIDTLAIMISEQIDASNEYPFHRWYWVNSTIFDLYKAVFKDEIPELNKDGLGNKRFIVDSDRNWLDWGDKEEKMDNWGVDSFKQNCLWGYELILPKSLNRNQVKIKMKNDLDDFFGFSSKYEMRKVRCLILNQKKNNKISIDSIERTANDKYQLVESSTIVNLLNTYLQTRMPIMNGNLESRSDYLLPKRLKYTAIDMEEVLILNNFELLEEEKDIMTISLKDKSKSL